MAFKRNNVVKISTLVLGVFFLFTLFNFYKVKTNFEAFKKKADTESKIRQNQFDEILTKYDSVSLLSISTEFPEDKKEINFITDDSSDDNFENDANQYSLEYQMKKLKLSIVENTNKLEDLTRKINDDKKSLKQLESLKSPEIKIKADKLSAININARGVKILSDIYSKSKGRKIEQIRVCFTVEGNEFVKKGDKKFYIQVVNPKNQIISVESTFIELKDIKLVYSAKVEALYTQKDTDICTYVDLEKNKTIKGKYKINIYNEFSKIGTAIFELN